MRRGVRATGVPRSPGRPLPHGSTEAALRTYNTWIQLSRPQYLSLSLSLSLSLYMYIYIYIYDRFKRLKEIEIE